MYTQEGRKKQQKKESTNARQLLGLGLLLLSCMNPPSCPPTCSLAADRTPVMVPPARPAAYARFMEGYLAWSGLVKVRELALKKSRRGHVSLRVWGIRQRMRVDMSVIGSIAACRAAACKQVPAPLPALRHAC